MGTFDRLRSLRNLLRAEGVSPFEDVNVVLDLNVGRSRMPEDKLTEEELEEQRPEQLPDREVMSTISPSIAPEPPVPLGEDLLYPTDPIPKP
jgi:hypothetical protein